MSAILEWKDQVKSNQPFIVGLGSRFYISDQNQKSISNRILKEIKGRLVFCDPSNANPKIRNESELAGAIVVITRGGNSFATKYCNAVCLGASLVLIANNDDSPSNSIFSCFGDISKSGFELPQQGLDYPPCLMISLSSYRRLRLETPFMLTVSPLQVDHLPRVTLADLGASIRGAVVAGQDPLVKAIVLECISRDRADASLTARSSALSDAEAGRGANSLHLAVESNQPSCLSTLLHMGANSELSKSDGYSALHLAAEANSVECAALLADCGAYLDQPHSASGWTALHIACKYKSNDVLQVLIEAGANVNARATDGATPLHVACLCGNENGVTQLIRAPADPSLETIDGTTAATIALYAGFPNCSALMEKHAKIGLVRKQSVRGKDSKSGSRDTASDWGDRSAPKHAPAAKASGSGLLDEDFILEDVFLEDSSVGMGNVKSSSSENEFRRELTRRPSTKAVMVAESSSKAAGEGSVWLSSLETIAKCSGSEVCRAVSFHSEPGIAEVGWREILEPRVDELVEADLSRCCFIPFRHGRKRALLKRLLVKLLSHASPLFLDAEDSQSAPDAATAPQLSYKQGLLSLLAPIVDAWFTGDATWDSTGTGEAGCVDSEAYEVTAADEATLIQCSKTFSWLLTCFPSVATYLLNDGRVDSFQSIFDAVVRLLNYWAPFTSSCLAWRNFPPALFAVPWATTLMADVLSLADIKHLWSRLFQVSEEFARRQVPMGEALLPYGDRVLTMVIASTVLQLRHHIDPVHAQTTTDGGVFSEPATPANIFLPSQEELLMLFSSTNNDAFHESLFESKAQGQSKPDEGLSRKGKRIDTSEVVKSLAWMAGSTPHALFRKSSVSQTPSGAESDAAAVWHMLGDVPVLKVEELSKLVGLNSIVVLDVSRPADLGVQYTLDEAPGSQLPKEEVASKQGRRSSYCAGSLATEVMQSLAASLESRLASLSDSFDCCDVTDRVQLCLFQELKLDGMVRYHRGLATAISGPHSRHASPPLQAPCPPLSLRQFAKQGCSWSTIMTSISQASPENDLEQAARSTSIFAQLNPIMVITSSSTAVSMQALRDVAATLVTCGFSRIIIAE